MNPIRIFVLGVLIAIPCLVYSSQEPNPTSVSVFNGLTAHTAGSIVSTWGTFLLHQRLRDSDEIAFKLSICSCLGTGFAAWWLGKMSGSADKVNFMSRKELRQVLIGIGVGMCTPFIARTLAQEEEPPTITDLVLPVAGMGIIGTGLALKKFFEKTDEGW
jgi:hypothetical protein